MRFRYYIADLLEGTVFGTGDLNIAKSYADSEEAFVIDSVEGKQLLPNDKCKEIEDSGL